MSANPSTINGGQVGYAVTTPGGSWAFMSPVMPPMEGGVPYMNLGSDSCANLVAFNGGLYCFGQGGPNNSGLIASSFFNGDSWQAVEIVVPATSSLYTNGSGAGFMSYSPGPVVFQGALYLFFNGAGMDGWIFWVSSTDGKTWSTLNNNVNSGLSYWPSAVVLGEQLWLGYTARDQGNSIWVNAITSLTATNIESSRSQEIKGLNSSSVPYTAYNGIVPPALAVFNNTLYLFYITDNWTIAYVQYQGGISNNSAGTWSTNSPIPNSEYHQFYWQ